METQEKPGRDMHSGNEEARRLAASLMGSATTERKREAVRANVAKATAARTGKPMSEEHKQKIADARRKQEQERKQQAGAQEPTERRRAGRPKGSKNKPKAAEGIAAA